MTSPAPPGSVSTSLVLQPPAAIDYTSRDWQALVQSMVAYGGVIMPNWNPSSEGDFGLALVELFAYMGDIMSYYIDRVGQEAYLPTATQRISLLNIAKLLGYTVSNGTAATGTVTFQTTPTAGQILIPQGTQVGTAFQLSNNAPVIYETTGAYTCPGAGGTVTVPVSQGLTYNMQPIGVTSGQPGQIIQLPATGVITGSISIFVATVSGSQQWNYIQYLIDAGPDALDWTWYLDANGFINIQFGDNINGAIPAVGLQVWATYTVGLGSAGNQAAGLVGVISSPPAGLFVATNADGSYRSSAMTGGSDPESNDQIRANAPGAFQTQQRAVSPDDFQNLVLSVPGVTAASVVANHSTSVSLYVLGPSFQPPGTGLTNSILEYFEGKTLHGVTVTCGTPSLIPINCGSASSYCQIQCDERYIQANVLSNCRHALTDHFQPPNASFGHLITLSDIIQVIMNVPGVTWCTVPVFTRTDAVKNDTTNIQLRDTECATPGTFYLQGNGGR